MGYSVCVSRRTYTSTARQLALVELLRRDHAVTKEGIKSAIPAYTHLKADSFEKAFTRDLTSLLEGGYRIWIDLSKRYHLEATMTMDLSNLDVGFLRTLLSGLNSDLHSEIAHGGVDKILANSTSSLSPATSRLVARIPQGEETVNLARALSRGLAVSFTYASGKGERRYLLLPRRLAVHYESFYVEGPSIPLVGRECESVNFISATWKERTFRVSRIGAGTLTFHEIPAELSAGLFEVSREERQDTQENDSAFLLEHVILAFAPGVGDAVIGRGTHLPSQPDVPGGWRSVLLSPLERNRLCDIMVTYGVDVRLLASPQACHMWQTRLTHVRALTTPTPDAAELSSLSSTKAPSKDSLPPHTRDSHPESTPLTPSSSFSDIRTSDHILDLTENSGRTSGIARVHPGARNHVLSTHEIVRIHALLVYLERCEGSPSLNELATHFNLTWKKVLELLWVANTLEFAMIVGPFDLELPMPVGQEDEGEPPTTGRSRVRLGDSSQLSIPSLSLTLDETILVLGLIDEILALTPHSEVRCQLRDLRWRLVAGAEAAGFVGAMWSEPELTMRSQWLERLASAIDTTRFLTFSYTRPGSPHPHITTVEALPIEIRTGINPTLLAYDGLALKTYRLDRIASPRLSRQATRGELRELARMSRNKEHSFEPHGKRVELEVGAGGRWARETLPILEAREEEDRLILALASSSPLWLASLALQLGEELYRIEPASVRAELAAIFSHFE